MVRFKYFSIAIGLLACIDGGVANAAIYVETFQGTATGIDALGLFGIPGKTLSGDAFSVVFTINGSLGINNSPYSGVHQIYGGTTFLVSDPVIGSVTINGVSFTVGSTGGYGVSHIGFNPAPQSGESDKAQISAYALDYYSSSIPNADSISLSGEMLSNTSTTGFPTNFGQSYSIVSDQASIYGFGSLYIRDNNGILIENILLNPSILTPNGVSAAPEPASWALMIAGFGGVGGVMRRRRSTVAA